LLPAARLIGRGIGKPARSWQGGPNGAGLSRAEADYAALELRVCGHAAKLNAERLCRPAEPIKTSQASPLLPRKGDFLSAANGRHEFPLGPAAPKGRQLEGCERAAQKRASRAPSWPGWLAQGAPIGTQPFQVLAKLF